MISVFKSINPKNGKIYRTFDAISSKDLESSIDSSYQRFVYKYHLGVQSKLQRRFEKMAKLGEIMKENKNEYAMLMT